MKRPDFVKRVRETYYGPFEFFRDFPDEASCEEYLFNIKYPEGYICKRCTNRTFYRLKGTPKRSRKLQCRICKKQESLTAGTIFQKTRTPLHKWFFVMFSMAQTKKGKSARQLSKELHIDETTTLLMMSKVRKSMEEDMVSYQIGGPGCIVEADEIEIGGKGREKCTVLVMLEKNTNGKKGRIRLVPIANKQADTVEKALVPLIKKGTKLHTDGNPIYSKLAIRYPNHFSLEAVTHWEEGFSHEFLKDLNTIVSNLKRWYRGIHHAFSLRNTAYYLNEFSYRFNRRRSESNIFFRLIKRSIERPKILSYREFSNQEKYLPLAS